MRGDERKRDVRDMSPAYQIQDISSISKERCLERGTHVYDPRGRQKRDISIDEMRELNTESSSYRSTLHTCTYRSTAVNDPRMSGFHEQRQI